MSLIAELRRRNVIRMAGLYLVSAWLLTQVASTVLPAFEVPAWALRGLIIALALGFVPALIFAWVFDLTPEGLKRDARVKPEESIAPQTARRLDRMIIAVLSYRPEPDIRCAKLTAAKRTFRHGNAPLVCA